MSVIFQTLINTRRLYSYRNLKKSLSLCRCVFIRKVSDGPRKFVTFDEVSAARRAEARRSVVVQVNSEASFGELHGYCSTYAEVRGIHHYKNLGGEHFMLIEFKTEENLQHVLKHCSSHQKEADVMSLRSPFLWFRAAGGKKEKLTPSSSKKLVTTNGTEPPDEDALYEELMCAETVSDQIQLLYDRTVLNDIGVRLRYLIARELEMLMESLYSNMEVRLFGSSVNGFGRMGCDLDLVLTNVLTDEMTDPSRRLVFHARAERAARALELAGAALEPRAAGRVLRVLHARVPILKFQHQLAQVDCDVAYNNIAGVHMSSLLHALGARAAPARALTAAARRWARGAALAAPAPGRGLTHFPLTLMVLHFLQRRRLLPPLGRLEKDITKDNVNWSLDDSKLAPESQSDSLETLLLQFFEFYAQFDFHEKAISLNEGKAIRKPNTQPLYIVNPLDKSLNVTRNVSYEECERLKLEVRNAAWQLEAGLEGTKTDDWGLLGLIDKKNTRELKKLVRMGNSQRLVSVKDLFCNEDDGQPTNEIKTKLERLSQKSEEVKKGDAEVKDRRVKEVVVSVGDKKEKIKFKNSQVASEVYRIRRDKIV